jgi:uncharacterized protein YcbX
LRRYHAGAASIDERSMMVAVEALYVYPLKSARGVARERARLGATGFEWDRHWMATDANGRFVSQRTHPKLARIDTAISATVLTLRAPGLRPLELSLEPQGTPADVQVWKDACAGLDQGADAADWMSAALEEPVRLVRVPQDIKRRADARFAGADVPVSFADGFPFLVCNSASLDALNERMPEAIPMNRFRPNIVLSGLDAFVEDSIASLHIGRVALRLVKPCTRCSITATDQYTGLPGANPLPVLRTFRFDSTLLGVAFGENAVATAGIGEEISRGAQCRVVFDA